MQPEFLFRIVDNKWIWKDPNGKDVVMNFLQKYNNKKRWIKCVFRVVRKPKTPEQLGYYFTAILPTTHQQLVRLGHTKNIMGVEMPIDEEDADKILKHFCSRLAPNGDVLLYEENPNGKILLKRDMTQYQASMYIGNCIFWNKDKLSCIIPEAKEP